ncbi:MAG: hypothetical protein M3066_14295 [Actinomycetota bacterium]|nr:hypothetical protein [Actinomycetota bacterium]
MAVLIASVTAATMGAATADAGPPKSQAQPSSTWIQPGTAPLDGLGTYVYVAPSTSGPGQGSVLGYEYTLVFRFEDRSGGVLALGYQNGRKVAGFGLIPNNPVSVVPFDWAFGRFYFLRLYRLGPHQWGGSVYDPSAARWTFIAQQAAPTAAGGIVPTSSTRVDYDATTAPTPGADQSTCAFYPRMDAYLSAPTGWRGSVTTTAKLDHNTVDQGDCPATVTPSYATQHYALGTTLPA